MRIRLNTPTPEANKEENSKKHAAIQTPPPPPGEVTPESPVNRAAAQAEGGTTEGASSARLRQLRMHMLLKLTQSSRT